MEEYVAIDCSRAFAFAIMISKCWFGFFTSEGSDSLYIQHFLPPLSQVSRTFSGQDLPCEGGLSRMDWRSSHWYVEMPWKIWWVQFVSYPRDMWASHLKGRGPLRTKNNHWLLEFEGPYVRYAPDRLLVNSPGGMRGRAPYFHSFGHKSRRISPKKSNLDFEK